MQNDFIFENSHSHKIKTLIISLTFLAIILVFGFLFSIFWYNALKSITLTNAITSEIRAQIMSASPAGLFYAHFLGGLFFVPSPDEIIFYYGITKNSSIILSFCAAVLGYMIAQVINYFVGLKMSAFFLNLISKKKVYKTRRYVNKYGAYGIFIFNFLPFPAPLLTFSLGIAKYSFRRFFILTLLGKMCKYSVIIGIYFLFSA